MNQNNNTGFRHDQELVGTLIYIFITQKRYDILKLSQQLGMEYADLYAFVSGRRTMPITLLKRITELTGDKIFFDTVFAGSNIVWNFRSHKHTHSNNPTQEALEAVGAVGEFSSSLKKALDDGKISESERIDIMHRLAFAIQELTDVAETLKSSEVTK